MHTGFQNPSHWPRKLWPLSHSVPHSAPALSSVTALVTPHFPCVCFYSCLLHQTGGVNRLATTGVKSICGSPYEPGNGDGLQSRLPPPTPAHRPCPPPPGLTEPQGQESISARGGCERLHVNVSLCTCGPRVSVPCPCPCVNVYARIPGHGWGRELGPAPGSACLRGCPPEKMSFSFMMLTSRLLRCTAALSMICSGL